MLRPLISPNNTINANPGSNTLVITDYADNLSRLGKIIAALDQPAASEIEVVPLKYALAADIAPVVQRLADSSAQVPGLPPGSSGGVSVIADSRSNALIVRAANPARQAHVRSIIGKLDLPTQGGGPGGSIWVVHLKNADAVKLAQVLARSVSERWRFCRRRHLREHLDQPARERKPVVQLPATAPVQASTGPSTGGFIQADPSTNSLIITAAEPLYQQLRNVIDRLDSRRAQVYIETLIVKVDAEKMADIGVQWQGIAGEKGDNTVVGGGTNYGQPATSST